MTIWDDLPQPFFVLAPMEAVTDHVFRQVVHIAAPADIYMTEFTNATSFAHPQGRSSTEARLQVANDEGPIIAQIWGSRPDDFAVMSQALAARGTFAGIDINLGCPAKDIIKQGACSALIGNEAVVSELISAAKSGGLPVSVKTRLGTRELQTEEWIGFLLSQNLAAITIHGRTVKEMSKVPAHWDEIGKAVQLRNSIAPATKIIGNGDVRNYQHGRELADSFGVDGIMIGRGIFHDIYAFAKQPRVSTKTELLKLLNYHLELYEGIQTPRNFAALKKFFKVYISGYPGAHDLRARLMETNQLDDVKEILRQEIALVY